MRMIYLIEFDDIINNLRVVLPFEELPTLEEVIYHTMSTLGNELHTKATLRGLLDELPNVAIHPHFYHKLDCGSSISGTVAYVFDRNAKND